MARNTKMDAPFYGKCLLVDKSTVYREEAQTIQENCNTHLYLSPADATAEKLERILGQTEYEDEKGRVKVRPLMSRQQIKALGSDKGIALFPNANPMLCNLTPYYKSRFRSQTIMPPYASLCCPPYEQALLITEPYLELFLNHGRV